MNIIKLTDVSAFEQLEQTVRDEISEKARKLPTREGKDLRIRVGEIYYQVSAHVLEGMGKMPADSSANRDAITSLRIAESQKMKPKQSFSRTVTMKPRNKLNPN